MKTIAKSPAAKRAVTRPTKTFVTKQGITITQEDLRSAMTALLHDDPTLLRDAVAEFMEDEGLYRAMKEVEDAGEATADEVYQALQAAKRKSA